VTWSVLDPAPQNESVANAVFTTLVWGCGAVVRRQSLVAGAARSDAAAERRLADVRSRELLRAERARIARELHDVVAHGIAVTVLQARGGRKVLATDPGAAAAALADIERVSAQSLAEMRRLVGMLRDDGPDPAGPAAEAAARPAPQAPQPGLRDLDLLVAQVRAAGLETDVTVTGPPRDLPPGLDLSAYRIVQEALTNVLRHAPGARACLRVRYEPHAVTLDVTDDGPPSRATGGPAPPVPPGPPGHGLTGMRERAGLFGGTLECGPRAGGGYGVLARLPVPAGV
jgi:signal transduction histidine kinase